jgi:hypothetical protein
VTTDLADEVADFYAKKLRETGKAYLAERLTSKRFMVNGRHLSDRTIRRWCRSKKSGQIGHRKSASS